MPLRLAAPQSSLARARPYVLAFVVGIAALLAARHYQAVDPHGRVADAAAPIVAAPAVQPAPHHGRWKIVFERPQACDAACERVIETLNAVARDPASGVPDGDAQVIVAEAKGEPARDLIVIDPEGRPAGFISHTTDAGRIVSGLATLRASAAAGTPVASR